MGGGWGGGRGSHPGSHGGTQDLMYMRVHEFEGAMFEDEIEYYAHYMGLLDSLWVVGAFILPSSESRLLCVLCVERLCIGT